MAERNDDTSHRPIASDGFTEKPLLSNVRGAKIEIISRGGGEARASDGAFSQAERGLPAALFFSDGSDRERPHVALFIRDPERGPVVPRDGLGLLRFVCVQVEATRLRG